MPNSVRGVKRAEKIIFHRASQFEVIIDKLVPYVLFFVLIAFLGEFFFPVFFHPYEKMIFYMDVILVTSVLGIDLLFKYHHTKKHEGFFKKHWIDVLAVLPFFLVFRVFEEFILIARFIPLETTVKETQAITHELRGFREARIIVREAEATGTLSRVGLLRRWLGALLRSPRIYAGMAFYRRPVKKEIKSLKKEI